MPAVDPHLELAQLDFNRVLYDATAIRAILPHRHELEMLSAVIYIDPHNHIVAGYKDVRDDEFWVRGHFPGKPVLPGVLMCEAAAQLTGFYTLVTKVADGVLLGLGGIDNTRFRRAVVPGERLLLVAKGLRVRARMNMFDVQGYVGTELAFHTEVMGVVLARREE